MNQDVEHFGAALRHAREERSLTIGEIALTTKVPRSSLELIEAGALDGLPADVFVRGFIRSYARAVGVSELQPLQRYDRALRDRSEAARVELALPVIDPTIAGIPADNEVEPGELSQRRSLGLAVFVIVLLLIATITLSLLLRRPPPVGEGLSQLEAPASLIDDSPLG